MPIRINLLAEVQAAEELRRRDPVKRVVLLGALLVVVALFWSAMVEINAVLANQRLAGVQTAIDTQTNEYYKVLSNQKKVAAANTKLAALQKLQAARFLQGTLLDALQRTVVNGVQLTRMRLDQSYVQTGGTETQTNADGHVIMGRPPVVRERIIVSLDARDFSSDLHQFSTFKDAIAGEGYFKSSLDKTNINGIQLTGLSSPQNGPDSKPFLLFTLELHYPDKIR